MMILDDVGEGFIAIVHFISDEMMPTFPYYQVLVDPSEEGTFSGTGEFVRFNHGEQCEVNGWRRVSDIVIDEYLEKKVDGKWQVQGEDVSQSEQTGTGPVLRNGPEAQQSDVNASHG